MPANFTDDQGNPIDEYHYLLVTLDVCYVLVDRLLMMEMAQEANSANLLRMQLSLLVDDAINSAIAATNDASFNGAGAGSAA